MKSSMSLLSTIVFLCASLGTSLAIDCSSESFLQPQDFGDLVARINGWKADLDNQNDAIAHNLSGVIAGHIALDSVAIQGFFGHAQCLTKQEASDPEDGRRVVSEANVLARKLSDFTISTCRHVSVDTAFGGKQTNRTLPLVDDFWVFSETERIMGIDVVSKWLDFVANHFEDKAYRGQDERKAALNISCAQHNATFEAVSTLFSWVILEGAFYELREVDGRGNPPPYRCDAYRNQEVCIALLMEVFIKITGVACDRDENYVRELTSRNARELSVSVHRICAAAIARAKASTTAAPECITVRISMESPNVGLHGEIDQSRASASCGKDRKVVVVGLREPQAYTMPAGAELRLRSRHRDRSGYSNDVILKPDKSSDVACMSLVDWLMNVETLRCTVKPGRQRE